MPTHPFSYDPKARVTLVRVGPGTMEAKLFERIVDNIVHVHSLGTGAIAPTARVERHGDLRGPGFADAAVQHGPGSRALPFPITMLERLPNELLSFIFRLACKDGGKTAGTLRLLSQRIKAVAAPYRFRTVAVAGAHAIVALVATLARIPPELRAIEHMFVAPYTASELSTYERRQARSLQDEEQEIVTGTSPGTLVPELSLIIVAKIP